jgi:hypothetical protein
MQQTQTIHIACAQCGAAANPTCACGRLEAGWALAEQAVAVWTPAVAADLSNAERGD